MERNFEVGRRLVGSKDGFKPAVTYSSEIPDGKKVLIGFTNERVPFVVNGRKVTVDLANSKGLSRVFAKVDGQNIRLSDVAAKGNEQFSFEVREPGAYLSSLFINGKSVCIEQYPEDGVPGLYEENEEIIRRG